MTIEQQGMKISGRDNMNATTTFTVICVAMFVVMASFGVMAAGSGNEATPASITYPVLTAENPAPVDLGTAGNFAILAKAAITDSPLSQIIGDVGASPITGAAIGVSCTEVTGRIYDVNGLYTGGFDFNTTNYSPGDSVANIANKTIVDNAVLDMGIAYGNATGRKNATGLADYNEEGAAGALEGLTLYPGIHKWSGAVTIGVTTPGDVTLDGLGNSNSVFIFQIAGTLTIQSGVSAKVLLTNNSQASNIFWAVAGITTLGTDSTFEGNILTWTASNINLLTGATLNGRALSDGGITLLANNVTAPTATSASVPDSSVDPIIPYWNNTGSQDITATGVDCDSIVLYYRYSVDNTTWFSWNVSGNDTASPWEWTFAFPDGNGYYQFYTRAWNDTDAVREDAPVSADALCAYDDVAPIITAIVPADVATGVLTDANIVVTWNETMAAIGTVTIAPIPLIAGTWVWSDGNTNYTYSGATWKENQTYTLTFTLFTDLALNAATGDLVKVFTTFSVAPTISTILPADGAIGVLYNANVIVTWSEAMNPAVGAVSIVPAPLTAGTWAWTVGNTTYTYSNATWNQSSILYTLTFTLFTDANGIAATGDLVKNFTTGSALTSVRLPVDLGTAEDFVVLAKTAVTTTGTTLITGDVGISPAAASYITGFGLILDSSTTFSTSSLVVGKVYAADYTPPTPTKMTTAVSDMETAYTDAAGRTIPDYVELGAGDITGMTLSPGLYKWDTGLLISAGGVTLSGNATAVWIFQIAQDLTVANGAKIILAGGARPYNIFWQVAGEVSTGTTVAMKGVILCQTQIVIKTGASFVGRALAQTQVTIDGNIITDPKDIIAPMVSSTVPASAATGVAINSAMTATFNEVMDPLTLNATTFTLKQGATPVSGTVTYSLVTAVFTPLANLIANTVYTATITTGAKDLGGNALASNYIWTFTTGAVSDTTLPTVSSTIPLNAATGVAINSAMTATFSEAMDVLTITNTTFTLKQGATPVSGAVTYIGFTATFRPSANLAASTVYTATITIGAKDLAGNAMASNYVWSFTTGLVPDTTAPVVTSTINANGATSVPINTMVGATFSEAMNPLTITTTTFTLKQGATSVSGTVTYSLVSAVFNPDSNLAPSTVYTVTVKGGASGVKDLAGNAMVSDFVISWTTGLVPDTTAPMVTSTINANGATGVPINTMVGATFSEAMDPITITTTTFTLKQGATSVLGTVTYSLVSAVFNPLVNLAPSTLYTATVKGGASGVKDLAGNAMVSNYTWSWTTGLVLDTTAPMVTSTIHANGATDVPINTMVGATFSEGMDPLTITTLTFTLKQGTTAVAGIVTYSLVSAVFNPDSNLAVNTIYTVTVKGGASGVKDLAGNAMVSDFVISWTTGVALDTTPPMVTSTIPANGATGISVNNAITATFSEGMDPLTITTITFIVMQGTTVIKGTVTYLGVTAAFIDNVVPQEPVPDDPHRSSIVPVLEPDFEYSTVYTATITTEVKDLAGNAMVSDYTWSWTTGLVPDTTEPMVTSTINANGAIDVPINTMVGATFSEAMDPLTITTVTFTLKQGTTAVAGIVTYSLVSAVFNPDSNLAANTVYTVTVKGGASGVKDLAGNAMVTDFVISWTTGDAPDTTAPTVVSTIPANASTGVAINSAMSATFSEGMDPLTITTLTFTLKQGTTAVAGIVTYSLVSAVFNPDSNLAANTAYTATITTGVKDLAGNAMANDYVWSFTTDAVADTTAPTVIATVNADGATNVATNTRIAATFSEAMDPLTITTVTFIFEQGTNQVSGTVTYSGVTAVFAPTSILAANTEYTATITTGAEDLAGNAMASNYVWSWTTGDAPDTTAPTVISTIPANAGTGVAINSAMTATFSEAMDHLTITTITFTLKQGTTPVSGTVTYAGTTATFTPAGNLAADTSYTATITTGATDLASNALAANYIWNFDTNPAIIPPTSGTIIGTVVDENGDPIEGAIVSLGDTGSNVTTNATGYYSFSDVAPGTYTLWFNASGYEPTNTTATVTAGETTEVPDTVMVPEDSGASNWWWIILVIAIILIAVYVLWEMAGKKKKSAEVLPKEGQGEAEKE